MSDEKLFYNKFEIPLTVNNTEEVFDNICEGNSNFIDSRLIKDVYMPVHNDDGTSGRPFWYNYSKNDYYSLIRHILEYKPIVITYPSGNLEVIKKYIDLGIKQFMVSKWQEDYDILKNEYKDLKIYRSIVGNSYNTEIDERFDAIVVPYKKLLDIEWIKEASQRVGLIAIVNHFCKVECQNLDNHLLKELVNYTNIQVGEYKCPKGRSYFLPREVVLKLNQYVSTFKIVDRLGHCFDYEKFMKYYIGQEMLNEGNIGENIEVIKRFYEGAIIHKLYPHSNLVDINCGFECSTCDKKCY